MKKQILLLLCLTRLSFAQSEAAVLSLTIPPGSRANAMGSAHTAVADDFLALYFNPAGIAHLQKGAVGYYHHDWQFIGNHPITFAGAVYMTKLGSLGFAVYNWDFNIPDSFAPSYYERAIQFTYARQVSVHFNLGGSVKWIRSKIGVPQDFPDVAANALGFDIGILVQNIFPNLTYVPQYDSLAKHFRRFDRKNGFHGLSFGLALLNTGPDKLVYIDESQADPLPQILRLGIALNAVDTDEVGVLLAFDLEKMLVDRENSFMGSWFSAWDNGFDALRFGTEVNLFHILAFRFGRDEFLSFSPRESIGEWTLGIGIGPEWACLNLVRRSFPIVLRRDKWVIDFSMRY